MTQIVDHGKWVLYKPDTLPEDAPSNALFARRESDGVDWYEFSRNGKNFSPGTVKLTVLWQDSHNGFIVGAATHDITRLFPAGQRMLEIIDYHGGDPQTELGQKLYDADTRTLRPLPPLPPVQSLEDRIAALETLLRTAK